MPSIRMSCLLLLCLVVVACGDRRRGRGGDAGVADTGPPDAPTADAPGDTGPPDSGEPVPFTLTSTAFAEGETIPTRYECGPPLATGPGENVTPPLQWTAGPPETMSYAIVVRDLDAGLLVHWVLYDIPVSVREVPEDVPAGYAPLVPDGARQAELQMSGYYGYLGPCSEGRVNTYRWTIHALATPTLPGVDMRTTENAIAAAVEEMAIASASLTGES